MCAAHFLLLILELSSSLSLNQWCTVPNTRNHGRMRPQGTGRMPNASFLVAKMQVYYLKQLSTIDILRFLIYFCL
ncbi:hypothetical protein BD769DRAFT_1466097 [Suillus cothurnatus]|nr:hypothetical protein BD769DRAFT_1466097 [Suillus cothurnatus]